MELGSAIIQVLKKRRAGNGPIGPFFENKCHIISVLLTIHSGLVTDELTHHSKIRKQRKSRKEEARESRGVRVDGELMAQAMRKSRLQNSCVDNTSIRIAAEYRNA